MVCEVTACARRQRRSDPARRRRVAQALGVFGAALALLLLVNLPADERPRRRALELTELIESRELGLHMTSKERKAAKARRERQKQKERRKEKERLKQEKQEKQEKQRLKQQLKRQQQQQQKRKQQELKRQQQQQLKQKQQQQRLQQQQQQQLKQQLEQLQQQQQQQLRHQQQQQQKQQRQQNTTPKFSLIDWKKKAEARREREKQMRCLAGSLDHLIDWDCPSIAGVAELPLFWDVALSGGTRATKITFAQCYHMVVASNIGKRLMARNERPNPLHVVTAFDGRKYVSVDTNTREGIRQASQLGFAHSNLTDLLFTRFLPESADSLFDAHNRGRVFSVFRHPVHRAVSMFYATKDTSDYAHLSLDEYTRSSHLESNAMVRGLTDKMAGELSSADTQRARELLGRKCLVGLAEDMGESLARFHHYFNLGDPVQLQCVLEGFASAEADRHKVRELDISRETWALLAEKNWADMRLYEYMQQLFLEQGKWLKKNKRTANRI